MEWTYDRGVGCAPCERYGTVEKQSLTLARALAVRQTTVPAATAADQVSVVLEPDEGEYQGPSIAAQSDRSGHGGRAKFARRG